MHIAKRNLEAAIVMRCGQHRLNSAIAIYLRHAAHRVTREVSGPKKGKTLGRKAKLKINDAVAVDTQQLRI